MSKLTTNVGYNGTYIAWNTVKVKYALKLIWNWNLFRNLNNTNNLLAILSFRNLNKSSVAEMGDRGHNRHGPKRGGAAVPFSHGGKGSWVPIWHNVDRDEVYFRTKCPLHPSSHLATICMGRKLGRGLGFRVQGAGSPSNTMSPRLRPTPYQMVSWCIQLFGHNRHGTKIGGAVGANWVPI